MSITIDELEQLARQFQEEDTHQREHLQRLIRAYASVIAAKQPTHFRRRPHRFADADCSDGSFPPEQAYSDRSGPALACVIATQWGQKQHTSSFYYDFDFITADRGLYVNASGEIFGAEWSGTGRFGQFPAYPGYCSVDASLNWRPLCADEISLADLTSVEERLRVVAHPYIEQASAS